MSKEKIQEILLALNTFLSDYDEWRTQDHRIKGTHEYDPTAYLVIQRKFIDSILALIASEQKPLVKLLEIAKCPNCDGSGAIPHQISDSQYVTHDMASDAGNPDLEGSLYSQEAFELEQCQWCDERKGLLEVLNGQNTIRS